MDYNLKYSLYNERSILVEWPSFIDENILKSIINYKISIDNFYIKEKVEIISSYHSILIIYDLTIDNVNGRFFELKTLFKPQSNKLKFQTNTWEIPVCYNEEFGIDLIEFSREKRLSIPEVIELHSEQIYTVFFIGFLPGFLYLGGLNPKLFLNRKVTPNLNVKKGSVSIGGKQTGIYPQDSPGGWHVIGKTPVELFNPLTNPPCSIKSGDRIRFIPINKIQYEEIQDRISESLFQLKPVITNA